MEEYKMDNESFLNHKEIFNEAYEKIKKENQNLKFVNLLVAGKSGVGKSTLINAVFGEELAKTGVGKPVTEKINLIEKDNFPVRIYDTVGFELGKSSFDISSLVKNIGGKDIKKLIKKLQNTETPDDDIHVLWYLISGTSARIEDEEIALINWMIQHNLPVMVILTKCYDKSEAEKLEVAITKLIPNINGVIKILAKDTDHIQAFGIDQLIGDTFERLPEGLQASFVHSQEASLKLKHSEAVKVINLSMAATFGTGFSPIVGSDAPLMMATQTGMIAKITSIYGIEIDEQKVETAIISVLGIYGALITGKTLSSNLMKLMPGVGTVGGGLISGGVGMVLTGALGYAYAELMSLVLKGTVDLSSITPDELTDILVDLLPKFLPQTPKSK